MKKFMQDNVVTGLSRKVLKNIDVHKKKYVRVQIELDSKSNSNLSIS